MSKIKRPTRPLADVNVIPRTDGSSEVIVCFMPDPDIIVGEGKSKALLALDGSVSMKSMFGFAGPFGGPPNYVELVSRKLGSTLGAVTRSGQVSSIYWAVGPDGSKIEEIGEFNEAGWATASIGGPKKEPWGRGTRLLEVIKYTVEKTAQDSDWTMGVIITDGIIDDEKECMDYCLKVGKELADGQRKPIKLVLIGIGQEVDEGQLERFDDMFEGTGIAYDLWSHGMVSSMQDEADVLAVLYGELMNEEIIIAPTATIEDSHGRQIASFGDGLPGKFRFVLPAGEREFTIRVLTHEIKQDISEAIVTP